jgi:hypothetical protein
MVGANLWPPESTGLGSAWKTPLLDLFDRKVAISRALTGALGLAMGRQEQELLEMCARGDVISIMRCFGFSWFVAVHTCNVRTVWCPHLDRGATPLPHPPLSPPPMISTNLS